MTGSRQLPLGAGAATAPARSYDVALLDLDGVVYVGPAAVPGVRITRPVEANAVFAVLPAGVVTPLQEAYPFYVWDEATGEVRWMTSFATTDADVDDFVATLTKLVG